MTQIVISISPKSGRVISRKLASGPPDRPRSHPKVPGIDRCDPDCYHYFTQILSSYRPKTRRWAPKIVITISPKSCRVIGRKLASGPPNGISNASKVLAILLGFWKLRNFLRPINASSASMKEAKAKMPVLTRHFPVWIRLRLVLCPVPPPTSQSFALGHGTCGGQRRV